MTTKDALGAVISSDGKGPKVSVSLTALKEIIALAETAHNTNNCSSDRECDTIIEIVQTGEEWHQGEFTIKVSPTIDSEPKTDSSGIFDYLGVE